MRCEIEFRSAAEMRRGTLYGHAAVFDQPTQIRGGWEAIAPGAFDEALQRDNVCALINHDHSKLLGSTKSGTLKLSIDSVGLVFEVRIPDTTYGRDLREVMERGDLWGASFGFLPGEDALSVASDGRQLRTHTSVAQLIDVSAVTAPAYEGTDVSLRSVAFVPPPLDLRTQLILARYRAAYRRPHDH